MPEPIVTPKDFENVSAKAEPVLLDAGEQSHAAFIKFILKSAVRELDKVSAGKKAEELAKVLNNSLQPEMGFMPFIRESDITRDGDVVITLTAIPPSRQDDEIISARLMKLADRINQDGKIKFTQEQIDELLQKPDMGTVLNSKMLADIDLKKIGEAFHLDQKNPGEILKQEISNFNLSRSAGNFEEADKYAGNLKNEIMKMSVKELIVAYEQYDLHSKIEQIFENRIEFYREVGEKVKLKEFKQADEKSDAAFKPVVEELIRKTSRQI